MTVTGWVSGLGAPARAGSRVSDNCRALARVGSRVSGSGPETRAVKTCFHTDTLVRGPGPPGRSDRLVRPKPHAVARTPERLVTYAFVPLRCTPLRCSAPRLRSECRGAPLGGICRPSWAAAAPARPDGLRASTLRFQGMKRPGAHGPRASAPRQAKCRPL